MGNISLVDELLGLEQRAADCQGIADFAASIAASNGMLIPMELLVQARLPASADLAHAQWLQREYRHKSRLLDTDRHIVACVCDILPSRGDALPIAPRALAACVEALAPAQVPRVLAFGLDDAHHTVIALLGESDPAELVMLVELDTAPRDAVPQLRQLRLQLHGHPGTRLVAVLRDEREGIATASAATTRALLQALVDTVDLLFVLPLLTHDYPSAAPAGRARYREIANTLAELGLARLAPGLYACRRLTVPQRPLPWLNRIMTRLPQADVLGLGPAARSRFNEVRFDNHVDPTMYSRDLVRGGYGIARTYTSTPVEQFIEALVIKLASGSVVDVAALAVRCQCTSPLFLEACGRTFDVLRATGAVSGADANRVAVRAANDAWFPEVHAQLATLRDATPSVTPLARR